jgi:hypothetical protein
MGITTQACLLQIRAIPITAREWSTGAARESSYVMNICILEDGDHDQVLLQNTNDSWMGDSPPHGKSKRGAISRYSSGSQLAHMTDFYSLLLKPFARDIAKPLMSLL